MPSSLDLSARQIKIHAAIRALNPFDDQPNVDELATYIQRALDTVGGWDGAVMVN